MPANCAEKQKLQPWMAHWPPAAKPSQGVEYGVQKGEVIVVDGTSAKASTARREPTANGEKKQ